MNIYVVINDAGIETYTQKGLIYHANRHKYAKYQTYGIRTVKEAKAYFEQEGSSVTDTVVLRG